MKSATLGVNSSPIVSYTHAISVLGDLLNHSDTVTVFKFWDQAEVGVSGLGIICVI